MRLKTEDEEVRELVEQWKQEKKGRGRRAAIKAMKVIDDEFITPAQAALAIGCNAQSIRISARLNPGGLGFPVSILGRRVRIPRVPFLQWIAAHDEEVQ